jgi:hypothetical protein
MVGRAVSVGSLTVVVVRLGTGAPQAQSNLITVLLIPYSGLYILHTTYGVYVVHEFLRTE